MKINRNGKDYYAYTANHQPDANRDTVVFVHGAAMDHTVWALQSRYFAYHGYNILAVNLPGHNLSQGEMLTSIESLGDWLLELIQDQPGRGFHFVGHSMGALTCLQAGSQFHHSERPLRSLSLVGFSYPMTVAPPLLDAAKNTPDKAYSMMTQWSHASPIGGEPNPGFWSPGMQMSMMKNSPQGAVFADLTACNNYKNGESAMEQIACPILFLSGRNDKMAPAKLATQFASNHAHASILQIPNCGHNLMSERPDEVLEALKTFIAEHRAD